MIKLFNLKGQQRSGADSSSSTNSVKRSAAQLRVMKDIAELQLPKTCETEFPDPNDLLNFKLHISPDEGYYRGYRFTFTFAVGTNYPHDPPKVKCLTPVYHPNIDMEGNVCLNILRGHTLGNFIHKLLDHTSSPGIWEDWKPVLTVSSIIYGLQYLFLEPNPEDPLNKEAAETLQTNKRLFEQNVQRAMRGGYVGNLYFGRYRD